MNLWTGFIAITLTVGAFASAAEQTSPDAAGLSLKYESLAAPATAGITDADTARLVSLYVAPGAAHSPFSPAGPFRATFEGDINIRLRSYVHLSAEGRGKLTVSVGGKMVLDTSGEDLSKVTSDEIRLNKGKNHLIATYESPKDGPAIVRLLWSSKTWLPEPLPPTLLTHVAPMAEVAHSLEVREGRFLFAEFRCVRCHRDPSLEDSPSMDRMPELDQDAPSLAEGGARLNQAWIERWVSDPRALRPDSHMPKVLKTGADPQPARDVAAYIASLGKAVPADVAGDAQAGGRLFVTLDCLGCHTPPAGATDKSRVWLNEVGSKFKPEALRQYLLNPQAHYAWNPMPNFRLSVAEASNLTAFLEQASAKDSPKSIDGDAVRGKTIVQSAGCLNCHQVEHDASRLAAPALAVLAGDGLKRGCLADRSETGSAPDFGLDDVRREALRAFLRTDRVSLKHRTAREFAERQITAMRCTACHARDGVESLLAQGLDAESQALQQKYPSPPIKEGELLAADQHPPLLTWAGEKLRPQWMGQFIAGQIPYKPRYYLRARMPSFPARAALIATGLAEEHGRAPALPPEPAVDPALAETGRQLCSKIPNQGFSCVQCHAVAGTPPFAPFEAPSLNFQYVAARIRHDYFTRWMHDPQRIDPNTKMPKFDDTDGKTGLPTFDGDSNKQFEAIWAYLQAGDAIKPPPG